MFLNPSLALCKWLFTTLDSEGLFSSAFLIFNGIVGAGIYATPSVILRASGSVGMSLVFWVVGAVFASAATAVFVELGTVCINPKLLTLCRTYYIL